MISTRDVMIKSVNALITKSPQTTTERLIYPTYLSINIIDGFRQTFLVRIMTIGADSHFLLGASGQ